MRKREFIKKLAKRVPGWGEERLAHLSNKLLDAIVDALKDGHRVEIRGFGTFTVSKRKPRMLSNPRTKTAIELPPRRIPRFKAGKILGKKADSR